MADDERALSRLKTLETTITQTIESPYPPSSELEGYERVLPGAAERIFALVEAESKHRRELEKTALEREYPTTSANRYAPNTNVAFTVVAWWLWQRNLASVHEQS